MDNADFIMQNPRAHAIFAQGWEAGYLIGQQDGRRDAGGAAEQAARAFIALEAAQAHTRAFAKDAADALTVPRFQARPTVAPTIKPKPTLQHFLTGLRAGGILIDPMEAAA